MITTADNNFQYCMMISSIALIMHKKTGRCMAIMIMIMIKDLS